MDSELSKIKTCISASIILITLFFTYLITYNLFEPKGYDFMIRNSLTKKLPFHNKKVDGSDDIVLVVVDAKTVEKYRWPWKRDLNCKIFDYFREYASPRMIVHDAILSTLDNDNIASDIRYFNSIKKVDNLIVGFMPSMRDWQNKEQGVIYDKKFEKFAINNVNVMTSSIPLFYNSVIPYPDEYFNSVKYAGSVSLMPGFITGNIQPYALDEIIRNYEYFIKYNGKIYSSLAAQAFLFQNNNPQVVLTNSHIKFPELDYKIKQRTTFFQSIVPIKYYKLNSDGYTHNKISAVDIMDSYDNIKNGKKAIIEPEFFKNKIVVFGANVPAGAGLNDNKNTPVISNHPGVDIQATAIDNIVHNDFLKVLPPYVNVLITLFLMLVIYAGVRFYDLFKSILFSIGIIVLYIVLSWFCFYFGCVINVVTTSVMLTFAMLIAYTHKFVLENKSKEKVKSAMGKYMSEDVMKRVMMNIDNLGLGGKKANVTVLFSDIRGFTSMSENMSAQEVSEILNEYFTAMEPIITKYNGIINKFIGDAVMAIFGEPIQDKNHPLNAVKCGYEMLLKVKELQNKWIEEGKPKIDIGIGINTGEVFVGNIGSVNRMEYTVIGDTVNLASRLESYNKIYKTKMLISSETYDKTKNYIETVKISDVEIRGKSHKMDIYEVLKVV